MTNDVVAPPSGTAGVPPPPAGVRYEPLKEVRFAVVIYGGVSLAIYINGIVQEMLALVRATAPLKPTGAGIEPLLDAEQVQSTSEGVYRKLGQLLGGPDADARLAERWAAIQKGVALPITTRFVIDVLSGTSAGGINAVFLAKALTNNAPLKLLEQLWETKGDIETLINDTESLTPRLTRQHPPQSLLNSRRMYQELLDALDGMDKHRASKPSPLVDKLDLFSTTTDVHGLVVPISLADGVVHERRHRNVFHFRYSALGPAPRSDFQVDDNPFLAYAARCTSAFPFAFEPMALCDIFPTLQTSALHAGKPYCDPDTTHWQKYYLDYVGHGTDSFGSQPFQTRPFGDGGYLDNKPFTYAINTLLRRHADLPVDRKLVYIEPSPDPLRTEAGTGARPDAIENSVAALLTLPRYETIRQDLELVVDRNVQIERINRVIGKVSMLLDGPDSGREPHEWERSGDKWGPGYATYEWLKVSTVTDELADLLAGAFLIDVKSALGTAVRILASVWRQLEFPQQQDMRRFLLQFDVDYRLRRIRQVWRVINEAYARPGVPEIRRDEFRAELRRIKDNLGDPYLRLQHLIEDPGLSPDLAQTAVLTTEEMLLIVEPPEDITKWKMLSTYPQARERTEGGSRQRASYVLQELTRKAAVTTIAAALSDRFKPVMIDASTRARTAVEANPSLSQAAREARDIARQAYEDFERYDSAAFPIMFGTHVGECDRVEIHRISPEDAQARDDDTLKGRPKLRGQALGAFGAFLDRGWRRNDILWGRLDGAERLIAILLPGHDSATARIRASLIDEAHAAITTEFLGLRPEDRDQWRSRLKACVHDVSDEPAPALVARSAARATAVTGELLEGIVDARRLAGKRFLARVALFGRFFWQFVEVSVPRTWRELFGTYFVQLFLLFATVLAIAAAFGFTNRGFAGLVVVAAVVIFISRQLLRRYLRGNLVLSPATTMAITAAVAIGLAIGIAWIPTAAPALSVNAARLGERIRTIWSTPGRASLLPLHRWAVTLVVASAVVTLISGVVMARIAARAPRTRRTGRRTGFLLQSARTWDDIVAVVGRYDLEARDAAAQVVRADFGFAAGYGLLFISIGLLFAIDGRMAGLLVSVLGAGAAVADARENSAILKALAALARDTPGKPLSPAPIRFSRTKWALAASAALTTLLLVAT